MAVSGSRNNFDGITSPGVDVRLPRVDSKVAKKRQKEVNLIIAIAVLILICTGLLVALLIQVLLSRKEKSFICHTEQCTLAAASILQSMDVKQDPCHDFYNYVCGEYVRRKENSEDNENWFAERQTVLNLQLKELLEDKNAEDDPEAVQKLRRAFEVCMNTTQTKELGITPLVKFLELLGGWPLAVGPNWQAPNGTNIEDLLASMERMGFHSFIIWIEISPDLAHPDEYRIGIDQPDNEYREELFRRKSKRNNDNDEEEVGYYLSPQENLLLEIVASVGTYDRASVGRDLKEMIRLKSDLEKIFSSKEIRSNNTRRYNRMTILELQNLTGNYFNWHRFLQSWFGGVTEIRDNEVVIVNEVEFMKKWPSVIANHTLRTITNYAVWNAVEGLIEDISPELYLNKSAAAHENGFIRWNKCISATTKMLPYALWRVFANKHVDKEEMQSAEIFVDNIRKAYKRAILRSKWLDVATKKRALSKIDAVRKFVGFPKWITNDTKLNEYYNNFHITDNHFINVVVNRMNSTHRILTLLRKPVDRNKWVSEKDFVNAFYAQIDNSVYFPAGIIEVPFFGMKRLQALNYGSIGTIIGHEIGHGFDNDGSQFNEKGELSAWWTARSHNMYNVKTKCFIDQYNQFCPKPGNNSICVNGAYTVGENMADNTGLQFSYKAYQHWVTMNGEEERLPGLERFTPEQIFFISYALTWCNNKPTEISPEENDPHSPAKYRVLGSLQNFAEFSRVFNCPEGPMNRNPNQCTLW